jgi:hypothetical protein
LDDGSKLGVGFHWLKSRGSVSWKKNRTGTVTQTVTPLGVFLSFSTLSIPGLKDTLIAGIPLDTTGDLLTFVTSYQIRPSYAITYDNRLGRPRDLSTFFRQEFTLRADGYLLPAEVAAATDLGRPINLVTESNIAQYFKLNDRNIVAYRVAASAVLPLTGKSYRTLTDNYNIGGASSVRAFSPLTIGPGSSRLDSTDVGGDVNLIARHSGNILLLGSVELRHKLGTSWEIAPFVDAGNVWLVQAQSEEQRSGEFDFSRFYRELASGVGLGVRYNLDIFVIRLDVAIPTTKPYQPAGSRLIGQPGYGSTSPRFNFAFNYPF